MKLSAIQYLLCAFVILAGCASAHQQSYPAFIGWHKINTSDSQIIGSYDAGPVIASVSSCHFIHSKTCSFRLAPDPSARFGWNSDCGMGLDTLRTPVDFGLTGWSVDWQTQRITASRTIDGWAFVRQECAGTSHD